MLSDALSFAQIETAGESTARHGAAPPSEVDFRDWEAIDDFAYQVASHMGK